MTFTIHRREIFADRRIYHEGFNVVRGVELASSILLPGCLSSSPVVLAASKQETPPLDQSTSPNVVSEKEPNDQITEANVVELEGLRMISYERR